MMLFCFLSLSMLFTACGDDDDDKEEKITYPDGTACTVGESVYCVNGVFAQPEIVIGEGVAKNKLTVDVTDSEGTAVTYTFKDLNGNGALDDYEDWRLSVSERAADTLSARCLLTKEQALSTRPQSQV